MPKKQFFINPTQGKLSLEKVVQEISRFIKKEPDSFYRLIIGSDSQDKRLNGKKFLNLVAAIVIHRKGHGGRYFWQKRKKDKIYSLRDKIYAETYFSLEVAQDLLPVLNKTLNGQHPYELEIHIDVGRTGETREIIKEVVGVVTGNGFKARTKPNSYGASKVADRHA